MPTDPKQSNDLTGFTYLQVQRDPRYAKKVKVVNATQRPPEMLAPDCVLVKVQLRVPAEVFLPYETEELVVPANRVAVIADTEEITDQYVRDAADGDGDA